MIFGIVVSWRIGMFWEDEYIPVRLLQPLLDYMFKL